MSRTIGFIGLGNMGQPMAANVAAAGIDLVCFDVAGTEARLPSGARAMSSAAELFSQADSVLLSLPDGLVVMSVIDEILAASPRSIQTVIDLSTVGPVLAERAAERLAAVGIEYVDGPVSGGQAGARAGTVSLMFGGSAETLKAHAAVFDAIAGNVFHCGDHAGQGQAMKLLNNYLSATALAATSEAVSFGVANGLDLEQIIDVLNKSTGRNSATDDKFPNRVITGSYDSGFHTRLMSKDVQLFIESSDTTGTRSTVAGAVNEVWEAADEAMPGSDFTEIWKFVSGS